MGKLEVVKMIETSLNHNQLEAIFSHGASSLTLKEADFSGSQIHNVSGSLIGKFATRLEKFSIGKTFRWLRFFLPKCLQEVAEIISV